MNLKLVRVVVILLKPGLVGLVTSGVLAATARSQGD